MKILIDFEASSLSPQSYPVQVAWSMGEDLRNHYINPVFVDGWDDWSEEAEAVHGISRSYLERHGEHPRDVAREMDAQLAGKIVYTDAVYADTIWCRRLFEAANLPLRFKLGDFWSLLLPHVPKDCVCSADIRAWLRDLHERACKRLPDARVHRADDDVRIMREMLRVAEESHVSGSE